MNAETFFSGQQLALYHLAQKGDMEGLIQATKAGVNVGMPGKEDMTMLGLTVITADRRAIISLMTAGADPNQVIPDAGSPAVLAISKHFNPPRTEAITALLDGGYDPNQILGHGKPYLFYFVDFNHWSGLKLALERGGSINVRRNNGKSLLTYMIEGGDFAHARELIAMGADVSARGEKGESALKAIEFEIYETKEVTAEIQDGWEEVLEMRELILSKLPDPKDRCTSYTDAVERKIAENYRSRR